MPRQDNLSVFCPDLTSRTRKCLHRIHKEARSERSSGKLRLCEFFSTSAARSRNGNRARAASSARSARKAARNLVPGCLARITRLANPVPFHPSRMDIGWLSAISTMAHQLTTPVATSDPTFSTTQQGFEQSEPRFFFFYLRIFNLSV